MFGGGPCEPTTINVPTSRSENLLTYTETSHPNSRTSYLLPYRLEKNTEQGCFVDESKKGENR
ncbi:hypothetical protein AVEN_29966-1, partial [Araneus ventricosus]